MLRELQPHFSLENHGIIWKAFEYLYISDRDLRERIAKALVPSQDDTDEPMGEKELRELIELQSFYNAVRLQLLQNIVEHIVYYYDDAITVMKTNLDKGAIQYQRAKVLDEWYLEQLNKIKPDSSFDPVTASDEQVQENYSIKLWVETIEVFKSVQESADSALKRIFSSAIDYIKSIGRAKHKSPFSPS